MRKHWTLVSFVMLICGSWAATQVMAAKPADGAQFAGLWAGNWEGGGTGKFDLTLQTAADGVITGSVAVGSEAGDYSAKLKNPTFAGNKLTATYDYPLAEQAEIAMTVTFNGADASGTWALGPVGQTATNAMATGTVTVKKK